MKKIVCSLIAATLVASPAYAAVMTFDSFGPDPFPATTYTEDGITVTSPNSIFWGYPVGGALHVDTGGVNGSYSFTYSGGVFDLVSFDATCCFNTNGQALVNGYDKNGLIVKSGNFDLEDSLSGDPKTLTFSGWTDLATLEIIGVFSHFTIDNLVLRAQAMVGVPEPSTWAMFLAGFAFVGGALRRRDRVKFNFA